MNAFSNTGTLVHSATNDTRLDDFMGRVREGGREEAMGKDSLPKLAVDFTRAIADGFLDVAKDSDGNDAAARVYNARLAANVKKQVHDHKQDSVKAQISKLRQIQNFAGNPKWDAVEVFNKTFTIRADHERDDLAVKSPYAAFVDVAREQLKYDDQLTDGQIGACVLATTKTKEVTLEGQLAKAHKILEDLITGEGKHGLKDQSAEVLQAAENISVRRNDLAQLMQVAKDDEALAEIAARRAA
jgi:hypothetical protein